LEGSKIFVLDQFQPFYRVKVIGSSIGVNGKYFLIIFNVTDTIVEKNETFKKNWNFFQLFLQFCLIFHNF
jgi:hypothetical protein